MKSRPELEAPPLCVIPAHPLQGKKPREKEHQRPACGVMSGEAADLRNLCPRGEGGEGRGPEKEQSPLKDPKTAEDIESSALNGKGWEYTGGTHRLLATPNGLSVAMESP